MRDANVGRGLAGRHVEFLAVGGTIGAGLFLGSGAGIQIAGPGLIVAYALTGAVVFIVTRCLAEMALAGPGKGTFVHFVAQYLGTRIAFVCGWSYWFAAILASMAELTAMGALSHAWFPAIAQWAPTFAALIGLFALNRIQVRALGEFEFWVTLLKILALVSFIVLGVVALCTSVGIKPAGAAVSNLWRHGGFFPTGLSGFLSVLPFALFGYAGAELIGIAAAETDNPARTLPRAVNALVLRLFIFYVGSMLIVMALVPWTAFSGSESPFVLVLQKMGIPAITVVMNIVLISALLSSCNSTLFGASRVLKSLASMGGAPASLARLNERGAPAQSALVSTVAILITIVLNYFVPAQAFGLLLSASIVCVMFNWVLFVSAHRQFRRQRIEIASPFRWRLPLAFNFSVMIFLALVLLVLSRDSGFRAALLFDTAFLAGLSFIAYRRLGTVQVSHP
jgi:L-asparagine transporter-like permease